MSRTRGGSRKLVGEMSPRTSTGSLAPMGAGTRARPHTLASGRAAARAARCTCLHVGGGSVGQQGVSRAAGRLQGLGWAVGAGGSCTHVITVRVHASLRMHTGPRGARGEGAAPAPAPVHTFRHFVNALCRQSQSYGRMDVLAVVFLDPIRRGGRPRPSSDQCSALCFLSDLLSVFYIIRFFYTRFFPSFLDNLHDRPPGGTPPRSAHARLFYNSSRTCPALANRSCSLSRAFSLSALSLTERICDALSMDARAAREFFFVVPALRIRNLKIHHCSLSANEYSTSGRTTMLYNRDGNRFEDFSPQFGT